MLRLKIKEDLLRRNFPNFPYNLDVIEKDYIVFSSSFALESKLDTIKIERFDKTPKRMMWWQTVKSSSVRLVYLAILIVLIITGSLNYLI